MELLLAIAVTALLPILVFIAHLASRVTRLERRLAEPARSGTTPLPHTDGPAPPEAARAPVLPRPASPFESLVGGRLLVWVGGVALVVAAVFLIRFSIEIGLITPALRMLASALFGLALLGGGEWARTGRLADDPRISQALVGAGLAVFYATVYGSYLLYGFLGLTAASALMLAVTATALGLSLRHGLPTAVMGLVGGYLTPLLVGNPKAGALPLLAYLALLDVAIFAVARRRGWGWMVAVAVAASYAWSLTFMFGTASDAAAAGLFVLVLAVLSGAATPSDESTSLMQPLALAAPVLAALAARSDLGGWGWSLFGLLGAAALAVARARPVQRWSPFGVLLVGLLLIVLKRALGDAALLPTAAAGLSLLFGGAGLGLALQRRAPVWIATACLGCAGPVLTLRVVDPARGAPFSWGLLIALAAAGPAILAAAGRGASEESRSALPALALTGLVAAALHDLVAWDYLSIAWLAAAIALIAAGVRLPDRALRVGGLVLLTLTVLKAFLIDAQALSGLLRILSFLGLGAALIVLGRYYGTLLKAERPGGAA